MPTFADIKRDRHRLQRSASGGASITLVSECGQYSALFECANRCAEVLGDRNLEDMGDGLLESIPAYNIPVEDLFSCLQKLATRFSVSLVEYAETKTGGRFVCLWRIVAAVPPPTGDATPPPASIENTTHPLISTNLDDY